MDRQIVILTKAPVPGVAKTRLIPRLGPDRAAAVHAWMAGLTVDRALTVGCAVRVALAGPLDSAFANRLRERGAVIEAQADGDLGARMAATLAPGRDTALLGTDCPLFDIDALHASFAAPEPVSIGPSDDGGYWTLRVRATGPDRLHAMRRVLFASMPWSTPVVLGETQRRCAQAGLDLHLLPVDFDVDEPVDLDRLVHDPRLDPPRRAQLLGLLDVP
jgi:rSAM/selenodomain-associated transferase 1